MPNTSNNNNVNKKNKYSEETLAKYQITPAEYDDAKNKLLALGYTETHVEKLILRKSYRKAFERLLALHDDLIKIFNHDQLIRIASHKGGSKNLNAVRINFDAIKALGTPEKIVQIVGRDGGSKDLDAYLSIENENVNEENVNESQPNTSNNNNVNKKSKYSEKTLAKYKITPAEYDYAKNKLIALGYTETHVEKLVLRKSYRNTFEKLLALHADLIKIFNHDQLIRIASQMGGSNNLVAVKINFNAIKELGFTVEQIVQMVSHGGGSNNLDAVKTNFKAMKDLGFTPEQIIQMVNHAGGSKNIDAVKINFDAIKDLDFTPEQIVQMVNHAGGSKNIDAVKTNFDAIKALGFTPEQIVQMVNHDGGSKNLDAVKTNFDAIKALGFTAEQIVQMVNHTGGSKNLDAVKTNFDAIKALGFTAEQIVQVVNHTGGSKNLDAVKTNFDAINILGFTPTQIIQMVSHNGGSKNLDAVGKYYPELKNYYTAQLIVDRVSCPGGWRNIPIIDGEAAEAFVQTPYVSIENENESTQPDVQKKRKRLGSDLTKTKTQKSNALNQTTNTNTVSNETSAQVNNAITCGMTRIVVVDGEVEEVFVQMPASIAQKQDIPIQTTTTTTTTTIVSNETTTQANNAKTFTLLSYLTTKKPGSTMSPWEQEKSKNAEIIKDPTMGRLR